MKRLGLYFVVLVCACITFPVAAGEFSVDSETVFAKELIRTTPEAVNNFTFYNRFTYEMGVRVSPGSLFLVRYEFPSGFEAAIPMDPAFLSIVSNNPESATAEVNTRFSTRSAGGIGSTYVDFYVRLGAGAADGLVRGDMIVLDFAPGMVFSGGRTAFEGGGTASMRIDLVDQFGFFDTGGTHSVLFGSSAFALDVLLDQRGSKVIDVVLDRKLFADLAPENVRDRTATVSMAIDPMLVNLASEPILGLEELGAIKIRLTGDFDGVTSILFPNFEGGDAFMTRENTGEAYTLTLDQGIISAMSAPVTIAIDGDVQLEPRRFQIEMAFDAAVNGNDRELLRNATLSEWRLNATRLVAGYLKAGTGDLDGVLVLTNNSQKAGAIRVRVYSWTDAETGSFEQTGFSQSGELNRQTGQIGETGILENPIYPLSTQAITIPLLSNVIGVDLAQTLMEKPRLYVELVIEAQNVTGLVVQGQNGIWNTTHLHSVSWE